MLGEKHFFKKETTPHNYKKLNLAYNQVTSFWGLHAISAAVPSHNCKICSRGETWGGELGDALRQRPLKVATLNPEVYSSFFAAPIFLKRQ